MSDPLVILLVVLQGLVALAFLRLARSFGAYTRAHQASTEALREVNESNLALHELNAKILVAFREDQRSQSAKGAA